MKEVINNYAEFDVRTYLLCMHFVTDSRVAVSLRALVCILMKYMKVSDWG